MVHSPRPIPILLLTPSTDPFTNLADTTASGSNAESSQGVSRCENPPRPNTFRGRDGGSDRRTREPRRSADGRRVLGERRRWTAMRMPRACGASKATEGSRICGGMWVRDGFHLCSGITIDDGTGGQRARHDTILVEL